MNSASASGIWVIVVTFIVAMAFMVMSLPDTLPWELGYLRPDWVGLVLFYWVIALPQRVGIFVAFLLGLSVDVLVGSLIGQHAVTMIFIAYVGMTLHQRLRMFAVWQQSAIVFITIGAAQLVNLWLDNFLGLAEWNLWYLLPAFISALLWPWIFLALRFLRRFFYVS